MIRNREYGERVLAWAQTARDNGAVAGAEHLSVTKLRQEIGRCMYGRVAPTALFMHMDTLHELLWKVMPADWIGMRLADADLVACRGFRPGTVFICNEDDPTESKLNRIVDFTYCETKPLGAPVEELIHG